MRYVQMMEGGKKENRVPSITSTPFRESRRDARARGSRPRLSPTSQNSKTPWQGGTGGKVRYLERG